MKRKYIVRTYMKSYFEPVTVEAESEDEAKSIVDQMLEDDALAPDQLDDLNGGGRLYFDDLETVK